MEAAARVVEVLEEGAPAAVVKVAVVALMEVEGTEAKEEAVALAAVTVGGLA